MLDFLLLHWFCSKLQNRAISATLHRPCLVRPHIVFAFKYKVKILPRIYGLLYEGCVFSGVFSYLYYNNLIRVLDEWLENSTAAMKPETIRGVSHMPIFKKHLKAYLQT